MRASGVRVFRVILPVMLFGLVVAVGNYILVEKILPKTQSRADKLEVDSAIASASPSLRSNVWLDLKQYKGSFSTVTRQKDDTLEVTDVFLGERPEGDTVNFISAPTGNYRNGLWTFKDVTIWTVSPGKLRLTHVTGQVMTIPQQIFLDDIFNQNQAQDKTGAELRAAISTGKAAGHDMTREELIYYQRFSVPGACIVFAIIAPIFALMFARTGSFAGVLLSFILVLLYYNTFVISTEIFGKNHWLSPWLAAWLPNFIFAAFAVLGVRRLE